MKHVLKACLMTLTLAALAAPALAKTVSGFSEPESVQQDRTTHAIYVSNVVGQFTAKDHNGFISKLDASGNVVDRHFLPKPGDPPLNGPKGLELGHGKLWVADIDRVVGYDLATRKQVKVYDLRPFGVTFANDLVLDGNTLYVSDTGTDEVISINLKTGKSELVLKGVSGGANGLFIDPATHDLLIAGSPADFKTKGYVWRVHTPAGTTFHLNSRLAFPAGIYDGLWVKGGAIYTSDWATGAIWKLAPGAKAPIKVAGGFKGAADFSLSADGKSWLVPEMLTGRLHIIPAK